MSGSSSPRSKICSSACSYHSYDREFESATPKSITMSTRSILDKFTIDKDVNRTHHGNRLIHDWLSCFCTLLISTPLFWFLILVVLGHSLDSSYARSRNTGSDVYNNLKHNLKSPA
ncbi:hypothetical protein Zmor_002885 [Zophobas morio]|uniref:Uncharacterized protein n=1 Tax=Zophobas morio TaxID=2755281 RepID=A0AA38M0N9_9CUCU|nr:hypothetical protein Zmor_002885 [Zophobas morio]